MLANLLYKLKIIIRNKYNIHVGYFPQRTNCGWKLEKTEYKHCTFYTFYKFYLSKDKKIDWVI